MLSLDALQSRIEGAAESGQPGGGAGLLLVEVGLDGESTSAERSCDELQSLLRIVRQNDALAQVQLHTFAILLAGLSTWKDARIVAERVQYALSRSTGKKVRLGLAVLGKGNIDVTDLWAEARLDLEKADAVGDSRGAARSETLRVRSTG